MQQRSLDVFRKVVRRLILEEIGDNVELEEDQVTSGGVRLLSAQEVQGWKFPKWFQNLLLIAPGDNPQQGGAALQQFNKKMYQVYEQLAQQQNGKIVSEMIRSREHPEFLTLYCSLMNAITPETAVPDIITIIRSLLQEWLKEESHLKLWNCLTGKSNEAPRIKPIPMKESFGTVIPLPRLPRYETEDLKQSAQRALQVLQLTAQQWQLINGNLSLNLTLVINELYKMSRDGDENILQAIKLLLKDTLSQEQKNVKMSSVGGSQGGGNVQQIVLGDNKDLLDDSSNVEIIKKHGLYSALTPEEDALLDGMHTSIFEKFQNLEVLYGYLKGSNDLNLVSNAYQDVKESVVDFLHQSDFDKDIDNPKMKAFMKYLILILTNVETKFKKEKQSVGGNNSAPGDNQVAHDDSLGDDAIHADAEILNQYIGGVNLLNAGNRDSNHVSLNLLKADKDFVEIYGNIHRLKEMSDLLDRTEKNSHKYSNLMKKYAQLVSYMYPHYKKLLNKLREDEEFREAKYENESGKNDTPKFLYQLLFYYEKLMKKMSSEEIIVNKKAETYADISQKETAALLKDFDMYKFKQNFVSNNEKEMNKYVKGEKADENDIQRYSRVIEQKHPELNRLAQFIKGLDHLKFGKQEEEEQSDRNSFFTPIDQQQDDEDFNKERKERIQKYNIKHKKSFLGEEINEGDWDLAMFEIFKKSVGDYLLVLKKVRNGVFDYVKSYGNVLKSWAYELLYKWEQYMKNIDIEGMLPGILDKVITGWDKVVNVLSNEDDEDDEKILTKQIKKEIESNNKILENINEDLMNKTLKNFDPDEDLIDIENFIEDVTKKYNLLIKYLALDKKNIDHFWNISYNNEESKAFMGLLARVIFYDLMKETYITDKKKKLKAPKKAIRDSIFILKIMKAIIDTDTTNDIPADRKGKIYDLEKSVYEYEESDIEEISKRIVDDYKQYTIVNDFIDILQQYGVFNLDDEKFEEEEEKLEKIIKEKKSKIKQK